MKHIDAHHIGASVERYLRFPSTLDGRLPSESFGRATSRVKIGETYHFTDVGENGTVGTVTAATVNEAEKATYVGITDTNGNAQILRVAMSDAEIAEYTEFRDAYFGRVVPGPFRPKDNFELFEWLMETHKTLPREKILEQFAAAPNCDALTAMSDPDLRAAYCEAMVAAMEAKRPSNPAEPAHATSARRSEGVARGGFIE